jgi:hypothetical protein
MNEHEWMARQILRNALALITDSVDRREVTVSDAANQLVEVAVSIRAHLLIAAAETAA